MRTTLDIDEDVLAVARALASARRISVGAAVSELAREGMSDRVAPRVDFSYSPFPVIVGEVGHVVTNDLVAEHRDD